MYKSALTFIMICSIAFIAFNINDDPKHKIILNPFNGTATVDRKTFDANNISTWYLNNGNFNRNPSTQNAGFQWPKGTGKTARYSSGLWLGCVSGNDTLTVVAEYAYDYLPGYVDDNGDPQTDPSYRIYKIDKGNTSSDDYINWPVNQGAYVTSEGKPYQMGEQTMFFVYTDGFPHTTGQTSLRSLKAQIIQTNWAYKNFEPPQEYPGNPLNNTIFMEFRIINRSAETWNDMWIAMWGDDDLGDGADDKIGCDTNLNLGYTYNGTNKDGIYGTAPPAVGFKLLRGYIRYTGNINDTVKYSQPFGSNNFVYKVGYRDEGLTVFNAYNGTTPEPADPLNNTETYRVLRGKWRTGQSWINPATGDTSTLPFSGDPVTGTGWISPGALDRRAMTGMGPYNNINPGDTLTIEVAQIIAKGNSNTNSVAQLKRSANIVQRFYENNLKTFEISPPNVSVYAPGDGKINLSWNDSAEKVSYQNNLSGGVYRFQGYNIYQINTFSIHPSIEDTVLIKTFDKKDGIKNINDSAYLPGIEGIVYGIVQRGSDNGISRYITIDRDTISNGNFINGTEYKFLVTAYYYDSTGGIFTSPKVRQSDNKYFVRVIPQQVSSGTITGNKLGDTLLTDQKDLGVMPVVIDPLQLVTADYTSIFGGTNSNPSWTLTKTVNGIVTILFEDVHNFNGEQDNIKRADGLFFIHKLIKDSGLARDPDDFYNSIFSRTSLQKCWDYEPKGKEWFTAPDTNAIKSAKIITNRQFESRSLGMSFPTTGTFRNNPTRVKANGKFFTPIVPGNPILNGGPLRKIKIVFGQSSRAYRFVPTDTNYSNTPYADIVDIPFSVFAVDELDSSAGSPRQLNIGFMDKDNDGLWNPDTSKLGNYHFTYIFASDYDPIPNLNYTNKNPGISTATVGFPAMDIMYAWLPRVRSVNGIPLAWSAGDVLTISPYRITRPEFVPGYPVKYNWSVTGTEFNNKQTASAEVKNIKVFPNPYYGFSELEYNDGGEKFIYVSHLPQTCTIFIYTLDGVLVKKINRNNSSPDNSLEKWDLKNDGGSYVASGMYIVYVDCKDLGVKTLKIAVFTR